MAQHDYVIDNQSFPATRTDINNALLAISSTNSGTSAPSTTYASQLWYDTTNNKLYIRNEDNDAWIPLFLLDQSNDKAGTLATEIDIEDASGTNTAGTALTIKGGAGTGTGAGGAIIFQTADGGSSGSSVNSHATRVTITDDGKVGIGEDVPLKELSVVGTVRVQNADGDTNGLNISSDSNGDAFIDAGYSVSDLKFGINGTERMRIDSSGNVLVDKTSTSVSDNGIMLKINGQAFSTTAGANTYHYYDSSNSRYNFYVLGNGGIANYSSNNIALSDQTEKKNIATASSAWDDVKALSVKEFHYNFEDDADPKRLGVIAQDVQANHPNLITEFEIDESTTKLGVVEQQLYWMAIKALQEAIAKIETLETKVAALEAE